MKQLITLDSKLINNATIIVIAVNVNKVGLIFEGPKSNLCL